jgi:hypothetical protein
MANEDRRYPVRNLPATCENQLRTNQLSIFKGDSRFYSKQLRKHFARLHKKPSFIDIENPHLTVL